MSTRSLGIGGCSLYVPRYRVDLQSWCDWTGASWSKTRSVVGRAFRMPAPSENVYTMAATAVVRLIERYDIDPSRVGFLGLGTESSTDNAAGAVIVKGLVNQALAELGRPLLPRACEVPEFKQACLGGVYALKSAVRYLAVDGRGRQAIVVSSDIARYQRGSSGEPTQGAGAVAQWLTEDPALAVIEPEAWAGTSDYRALDFRKPAQRFLHPEFSRNGRAHDFPVFNGRFSALCFLDEVRHAADELSEKLGMSAGELLRSAGTIFTHRPYARLPIDALATLFTVAWARSAERRPTLLEACHQAQVDPELLLQEVQRSVQLLPQALQGDVSTDPQGQVTKLAKHVRESRDFQQDVSAKLALGEDVMAQLGNLYTASLPAWIAAGLEHAARASADLARRQLLIVGYGSGDAAEAFIMKVGERWREAALKIAVLADLADSVQLSREQYQALHDGSPSAPQGAGHSYFEIERVGATLGESFSDLGVEYYKFARS